MAKFSLFNGGKITIYSGPVHRILASNFTLNARTGKIEFDKVKGKDKLCYFYLGDATGGDLINIEENCVLPNRDTAIKKCNDVVIENTASLMSVLTGRVTDPKEASRIFKTVSEKSTILYYDKNEVKPNSTQTRKQFKDTLKAAEEQREKNKALTKNKK